MTLKEKSKKKVIEKERKIKQEKLDKFFQSGAFRFCMLFSSMFTFLYIGEFSKIKEMNYFSAVVLYVMGILFIANLSMIFSDKVHHQFHKMIQSTTMTAKSSSIYSFLFSGISLSLLSFFLNPYTHWFFVAASSVAFTFFSLACVYQIFSTYAKKVMIGKKPIELVSIQTQGAALFIYLIYLLIQGLHYLGSTFFQWVGDFPTHINMFRGYFQELSSLPDLFFYIFFLLSAFLSCIAIFIEETLLLHKTNTNFQKRFGVPFQKRNRFYFQMCGHTLHFSLFWLIFPCHSLLLEKFIYGVAPLVLFLVLANVIEIFLAQDFNGIKKIKSYIRNHNLLEKKEFPFETNQYLQPVPKDVVEIFATANLAEMANCLEKLYPDVEKNTL